MQKFFNFINNAEAKEAELHIDGDIVSDGMGEIYECFGVPCVAPKGFKEELNACGGKPLNIYINSYGGSVFAASAIYSAIKEYKGKTTVKIDSIAASAATLVACAGDKVYMAKTAYFMIHEPMIYSDSDNNIFDLQKLINFLKQIREGILDTYQSKSHLSRDLLISLMGADEIGTYLNYSKALEYGFIDGEIGDDKPTINDNILNAIKNKHIAIFNKISKSDIPQPQAKTEATEQATEYNGAEEIKQKNINRYKALLLNKRRK